MKLLVGTLLFAIASSVFPLLNAEIFLAAVATRIQHSEALPLAVAAGAGQTLGKVVWYYAAQRSLSVPWLRKRTEQGRFKDALALWSGRINGRPWVAAVIMFVSALLGVPPLLVTAAAAGLVRMRLWLFVSMIMLGRTAQSYVILAGLAYALHDWASRLSR